MKLRWRETETEVPVWIVKANSEWYCVRVMHAFILLAIYPASSIGKSDQKSGEQLIPITHATSAKVIYFPISLVLFYFLLRT